METALLETENTKLELENIEHEAKTNRMMLVFLAIITLIIIIIFIAYSRMRGRVIVRLKSAWKHAIQQEQKAIVANNLKDDFIQNMSHEIRTPLNAIVGFSQMLSDPQMDGFISRKEKQEYGALIKSNANMMTSLIEDILSLTEIENGHYKLHTNEYNLNTICSFSVDTARIRCPQDVKMYFTSDVDDNYKVFTDSHRVQQVLMNLLTNSCKHTSVGEIHLHCAVNEPKEMITFTVTDTGKGVPPEMAEEIFERFKKLDKFVQGTGLGLSICRIIAELLDGKIYLDTTYTAGGARFVFEMKLYKTLPHSKTLPEK
jgi:signal transduction histidine kinase